MSSTKKPRRRLSSEEILNAALLLADRSGLESLTMRSLASEIGSDPTAVYRHFRDKRELLLAIVDLALADLRYPAIANDWRSVARDLAISLREILRVHPGVTTLIAGGPPTRGTVEATARALSLLQTAGMPPDVAARAHRSVVSYVVGWVSIEQGAGEQRQSHFATAQHLAQGFPGVDSAVIAAAIAPDRSLPGEFEFGLDLILDGLTVYLSNTSDKLQPATAGIDD
jgi:AcrR family transcriptional regulator